MTPELKTWIGSNTALILLISFAAFTVIMQILHWCHVNVLKVVVLLGTFSSQWHLPATTLSTS